MAITSAAPSAAIETLTQFLNHEARLLDGGRFDDWLALFTADATYWLPLEQGQREALEVLSHLANHGIAIGPHGSHRASVAHSLFCGFNPTRGSQSVG